VRRAWLEGRAAVGNTPYMRRGLRLVGGGHDRRDALARVVQVLVAPPRRAGPGVGPLRPGCLRAPAVFGSGRTCIVN